MKSVYLKDVLNYEYPATALNSTTSVDCTAAGFDASDLCRDFYQWRSNTTDQIDIYFEISDTDQLNCFSLINTNLSARAQVYVSGSNTSGIGGFYSPTFTRSLTRKNNNWIYYNSELLPSCRYYKMTIVEDSLSENTYIEIGKLLCGIAVEFPFDIIDGFTIGKESHQKRDTQKGQWRPGNEESMLNTLDIEFRPAFGTITDPNNEYEKMYDLEAFINDVRTTKPFLMILNPQKPEEFFEYMTIDGESIDITATEADSTVYAFTLKELK